MQHAENNSTPTVSYLIEHAHGTCELWLKQAKDGEFTTYEPLRFLAVSGQGEVVLKPQTIVEAISLDEWMADHPEVFREGRTSYR